MDELPEMSEDAVPLAGRVAAPIVDAEDVVKRYGRRTVVNRVSLQVSRGEVVALVGENGAGKTTLLRICAGLLRPDGGRVTVGGRLGYCPQEPGLLDRLSAAEHLRLFGAGVGLDDAAAQEQGGRILEQLRFPAPDRAAQAQHLSGGNRQKLNLCLALLGDPDALLLDEPYQGFDHGTYIDFWKLVGDWRDEGKAVVVVTHLLAELRRVDRVVELAAGGEGSTAA